MFTNVFIPEDMPKKAVIDGTEVEAMELDPDNEGGETPTDNEADAHHWTVFVHYKGGGRDAVADAPSRAEGKQLEKLLRWFAHNYSPTK
jgi:hypothetical protein